MDKDTLDLFIDFLKSKHTWYADDFKEGSRRIYRVSGCRSVCSTFRYPIVEVSEREIKTHIFEHVEKITRKHKKNKIIVENVTDALIAEFQTLYFRKKDKR